jgi:hypothetical protein
VAEPGSETGGLTEPNPSPTFVLRRPALDLPLSRILEGGGSLPQPTLVPPLMTHVLDKSHFTIHD